MRPVPDDIMARFEAVLQQKGIAEEQHPDFKKWLRYFLDFCARYQVPEVRSEQVRLFIDQLREKRQTPLQQKQAAHAVSLYFELLRKGSNAERVTTLRNISPAPQQSVDGRFSSPSRMASTATPPAGLAVHPRWRLWEEGYAVKSDSAEWDGTIGALASEIKTRHYSGKTLKTYAHWCRQFQKYLKNKRPDDLSDSDVTAYLTYLAVKCKVAASTQNQAFNALLFLYRHILKKDFGDHKDIPRAKRSKYIPVVLSRREIDAVLQRIFFRPTTTSAQSRHFWATAM